MRIETVIRRAVLNHTFKTDLINGVTPEVIDEVANEIVDLLSEVHVWPNPENIETAFFWIEFKLKS